MKRFLFTVSICVIAFTYSNAQQLPKDYYSKYYTPINNEKVYFDFFLGYSFPTGTISEQPSASAYIEDPFKGSTGLGLQPGYEFEYNLKISPGKEKTKYPNPRFMLVHAAYLTYHETKWDDISSNLKPDPYFFIAIGGGLDISYSLKDIVVLSLNYKIAGSISFISPGIEYSSGGYAYAVQKQESDNGRGFFNVYGLSIRYRKRLVLNFEIKSGEVSSDYTFTKKATGSTGYNPNDIGFGVPSTLNYSTFSILLGINL